MLPEGLLQGRQALFDHDEMLWHTFDRRQHALGICAHQRQRILHIAMRMNVDCLDPFTVDQNGQAP